MDKAYHLNLEVSAIPTQLGAIKQNNTNVMKFLISVMDNGKKFDLTGANQASITFKRPDGTLSNSNAEILSDGTIEYLLEPNSVNIPGVYEAEVQIFENIIDGGGKMLVTASFYYQVVTALANDEGITSQPQYPILVTLISDVENLKVSTAAAESARAIAENARANAEVIRQSNESVRQQFQFKGAYSGATAYVVNNVVVYNGSSYACIANTTGNDPLNATYWRLVVSKGDTGPEGPQGIPGPQGAPGSTWEGISNKPTTFPPSTHTHAEKADTSYVDTQLNTKANKNGGNQFVGAQNIENGSFAQKATDAQTPNKRWFSWYINTASYYLSAVNDAGVFVRNIFEVFHDGGMRIFGNLTVDGTFSNPITTTTITSGFASGWSGTVEIRKSLGNWYQLRFDVSKSTDMVIGDQIIITLPVSIRPLMTTTQAICLSTSGALAITTATAYGGVDTLGAVFVQAQGTMTNARRIIFSISYYGA